MKTTHTHCFVAGQSGGHILPCITLAQEHLTKHPDDTILFITTTAWLDTNLTQQLDTRFTVVQLPIQSYIGSNPLQFCTFMARAFISFILSIYYLLTFRPQSITSSGGICTIPVALAGYMMRIPIDLYELNVLPGKTTYALARIARTVFHCFGRTADFLPHLPCKQTGYPVRFFHEEQHSRTTSCTMIGFDPTKKTILILGGSQGSLLINTMIKKWIAETSLSEHIQIIHQTGAHDHNDWNAIYARKKIKAIVFPFNHDMEHFYAAADLVIARSGAGTLFEVLYFHTPCITIPLELKTNAHQIHNAFTIAQEYPELFHVITQDTLESSHTLENKIKDVLMLNASPRQIKHETAQTTSA